MSRNIFRDLVERDHYRPPGDRLFTENPAGAFHTSPTPNLILSTLADRPMTPPEFLDPICLNPDDDNPRMVYADWLDEQGDEKGYVVGAADKARAELIRLQIRISRHDMCMLCGKAGRYKGTHARWCEMTGVDIAETDIAPDKVVDVECPVCEFYTWNNRVSSILNTSYPVSSPHSRGTDLRNLPKIQGRELWKPIELLTAREVLYARGFVAVVSYNCSAWFDNAGKAMRAAPIESVLLCDRTLNPSLGSGGPLVPFGRVGYFWVPYQKTKPGEHVRFNFPGSVIPERLFDLCVKMRDKERPDDVADAYKWLNWASVHYGREEAKLPFYSVRPADAPFFANLEPGPVPAEYAGAAIEYKENHRYRPTLREMYRNDEFGRPIPYGPRDEDPRDDELL